MIAITRRPRWRPTEYLLEELHRYSAGIDADLEDIDLSGQNLAGINLTGATLTGASLNGANMRGAVLDRACLWNVDARSVDLTGASIREALIMETDLEHAALTNIDSHGSVLVPLASTPIRIPAPPSRFWMVDGLARCRRGPTTRSERWT